MLGEAKNAKDLFVGICVEISLSDFSVKLCKAVIVWDGLFFLKSGLICDKVPLLFSSITT